MVLWFTGLSGSGKSTLAHAVEERLHTQGFATYVFDGDNVRHGLCGDLGFSPADRQENIRRIAEMVNLFLDAGVIALTAFISPFRTGRHLVRDKVGRDSLIEIYCPCPLEICEERDVKGFYKLARKKIVKKLYRHFFPLRRAGKPGSGGGRRNPTLGAVCCPGSEAAGHSRLWFRPFGTWEMNQERKIIDLLASRKAMIGIVGLGYVGLPLMLRYSSLGFRVLGIDIDPEKVAKLNAGQSYIEHIPAPAIQEALRTGFEATSDFSRSREADALVICVPTPLNRHREPDISFVTGTMDSLVPHLRSGQVVSLESTTYPGTTEEELLPRIEAAGFQVGEDIFLVYSPEREDPGNRQFTTAAIPKVVGGQTPACLRVGIVLYSPAIDQVVPVSSTRTAEMTKLLENIHRAVNIGLVNEMKMVCDRMGIDIHEVIRAAATKPFGFVPYYPGPGLGGHCIPIDPFYLTWKAREYKVATRFIELAGEVNTGMPQWVVGKIIDALNQRGQALKNAKMLILGIAYKQNVDDMRESPAVELMELLRDKGAKVDYSDPHVPVFPKMRQHRFDLTSVPLSPEAVAGYDLVLLTTDHSSFDYEMIAKNAKLLVDTRGVYRQPAPNIIKA